MSNIFFEIDKEKSNINADDLKRIVSLHIKYLNVGLLSQLGENLLTHLYMEMMDNPYCCLILARHKHTKNILGFCSGSTNSSNFYKKFIFKNIVLIISIIFTKKTQIINLFLRAIHIFLFEIIKFFIVSECKITLKAQLLSIALDENYQSFGIGSLMFKELRFFITQSEEEKFFAIASDTQKEAQFFYKKNGGKLLKRKNIGFLPSNYYIFDAHA